MAWFGLPLRLRFSARTLLLFAAAATLLIALWSWTGWVLDLTSPRSEAPGQGERLLAWRGRWFLPIVYLFGLAMVLGFRAPKILSALTDLRHEYADAIAQRRVLLESLREPKIGTSQPGNE